MAPAWESAIAPPFSLPKGEREKGWRKSPVHHGGLGSGWRKMNGTKTDGLHAIAQTDDFVLYERIGFERGEWQNYKLVRCKRQQAGRRGKRCWWFGCNGKRLVRNRDMRLLGEREPKTYRWLHDVLGINVE